MESQIEIKMEKSIEERGLGDLESNPVQFRGLHEKDVQSMQQWDPEISVYITNKLEQIFTRIAESVEFTFRIYIWKISKRY